MGPVQVVVKSARLKSKFSKPEAPKPDYVNLVINGEEFSYASENEACANFWTPYVGKTITVQADGSRETATIICLGQPASQLQPPAAATAQPQPAAAPAAPAPQPAPRAASASAPTGRDMGSEFRHFVARNRAMAITSLQAAVSVKQEYEENFRVIMPEPLLVAVYNSMLFGSSNAGYLASNLDMPLDAKFKPLAKPLVETME